MLFLALENHGALVKPDPALAAVLVGWEIHPLSLYTSWRGRGAAQGALLSAVPDSLARNVGMILGTKQVAALLRVGLLQDPWEGAASTHQPAARDVPEPRWGEGAVLGSAVESSLWGSRP